MRHGPDRANDVDMGAMTTEEQLKTRAASGRARGSGGREDRRAIASLTERRTPRGISSRRRLMTDVDHTMELMREETFGPVVPVMKFRTHRGSGFGLRERLDHGAYVVDLDEELSHSGQTRVASSSRASPPSTIIFYTHGQSETPWGGWKDSGLGRTHSALGLDEMTQPKLVNWDIVPFEAQHLVVPLRPADVRRHARRPSDELSEIFLRLASRRHDIVEVDAEEDVLALWRASTDFFAQRHPVEL